MAEGAARTRSPTCSCPPACPCGACFLKSCPLGVTQAGGSLALGGHPTPRYLHEKELLLKPRGEGPMAQVFPLLSHMGWTILFSKIPQRPRPLRLGQALGCCRWRGGSMSPKYRCLGKPSTGSPEALLPPSCPGPWLLPVRGAEGSGVTEVQVSCEA